MKGTVQPTSKAAYDSLKPEMLREDYRLILFALKNISEGTSQAIAASLKLPDEKIRKRLSELATMGLIYKPGHTHTTKSGKQAFVWKLVKNPDDKPKTESAPKGISVSEYSQNIDRLRQASLF